MLFQVVEVVGLTLFISLFGIPIGLIIVLTDYCVILYFLFEILRK